MQIFKLWKVMESGLRHGKSWKINETVVTFLACTVSTKTRLAAGLCLDPPRKLKRSPRPHLDMKT